MPGAVVNRAWEVLSDLENGAGGGRSPDGAGAGSRSVAPPAQQLPLMATTSKALEELMALDVSSMTPLEAINKLYELQQRAREADVG
jgi:DNA mismatch repair protein MutS